MTAKRQSEYEALAKGLDQEHQKNIDHAANLAAFLLEKTGTVLGLWKGRMPAKKQRELFGRFIGKGQIVIDGEHETICNRVKVCFGHDYDDRNLMRWNAL